MKCYNCSEEISEVNICPYCQTNQIYEKLNFNVKGVTFENEYGKDIQSEIRKIFLEYERNGSFEKYGGYTNSEIKEFVTEVAEFEDAEVEMDLKDDSYEGKPCVKVYIKRYDNSYCHVGYMPKGLIKSFLNFKKHFKEMIVKANLVGGKIKQVEYDYITEKDTIETIELNYGFEVELIFYNDEEKFQEEINKNRQKAIEEWELIKEEQENKTQEKKEEHNIKEAEYLKRNEKNNIKIILIIAIISIPFVWLFLKILSFVFWLF